MIETSIIIGAYNHLEDCTKPCLEAIFKYTDLSKVEVVVVANGCKDGTKEYLSSLGDKVKTVWFDDPLGYARANNEGVKASSGEYLIFLNNDAFLLPQETNDWINTLINPFKLDNSVGVTGPLKQGCPHAGHEFIVFFCAATTRKLFDELGGLDEIFNEGAGEDCDFCVKAENAGYKIRQVPVEGQLLAHPEEAGVLVSSFPIYHKGEATVHGLDNWNEIFARNSQILKERYGKQYNEFTYDGNVIQLFTHSGDYIDNFINQTKTFYEIEMLEYISKYFTNLKTVLDIGSNIGNHALFFSKFTNCEKIICYEPFIPTYNKLLKTIEGTVNIEARLKAVGNKADTVYMYIPETGNFGAVEVSDKGQPVDMVRLDDENLQDVSLIKMDIEGHEYEALLGARDTLSKYKPALFLEIKEPEQMDRIEKYLSEFGYKRGRKFECDGIPTYEFSTTDTKSVSVEIATRNRYFSTLPLTIHSICQQTYPIDELLIFDDGDHKDLRSDSLYNHLFTLLDRKKIKWKVVFTPGHGQAKSHQMALEMAANPFILRVDDDEVLEPNTLEILMSKMTDGVGAVGGCVIEPKNYNVNSGVSPNKIEEIYTAPNIQWSYNKLISDTEVDHLYSSFLYRKSAAFPGYCLELSEVSHREETIFTYEMKLRGWKLLFTPSTITWHYRNPSGGIRDFHQEEKWKHDEAIFNRKMASWRLASSNDVYFVSVGGIGDHYCLKTVIDEFSLENPDTTIIVGATYPEVFIGTSYRVISIAEAMSVLQDIDKFDIYKFMTIHRWNRSFKEAYLEMYSKLYPRKVWSQ